MIYNPLFFSSLPADIRQNVIWDHEGNTPHRHGCDIALVKADDNFTIFIQIKEVSSVMDLKSHSGISESSQ